MIQTHVLGYPRIGAQRELKFALEKYWRGEISAHPLEEVGQDLRRRHWQCQHDAGLGHVTVGDFAFYDHVANHIQLFGCEPTRFGFDGKEPALERYFVMARGVADEVSAPCCVTNDGAAGGRQPLEMTKWFDTNYHYLVPEFLPGTDFRLNAERLLDEVAEARSLGHAVKVVLLGPLSFLWLGKEKSDFNRLDLLQRLLPAYGQMLTLLKQAGADWIQVDEPILGLDLPAAWRAAFEPAYSVLAASGARILLASYFSPLADNIGLACRLPVAGLHVDAVRAPEDLAPVVDWLPAHKLLSVGIIDGRNVWRTDLDRALQTLKRVVEQRTGAVWIAPSCSLLHVPVSLAAEGDNAGLSDEVQSWLAFADEKLAELDILRRALVEGETAVAAELAEARYAVAQRQASPRVQNTAVAQRVGSLPEDVDRRASPFPARRARQRQRLALPWFPTTTIGSFPQTRDIRQTRAAFRKGSIGVSAYREFMREAIADAIRRQEALGLDVLVHGEAERNDMVEYFGERLAGFAFTANGWVQSYGSRCVKPPVLYGDVHRPQAMTVEWSTYAASLTERPVKGMLTGPITILQWSFVRDDQTRAETAQQIALAIRDEVADLQSAGIAVIQIDEPAFREGLPLRRSGWQPYLNWASRAFRIAASAARDDTQVHTHMCYSEFNDILSSIAALDADVITIETSRSDMELLRGFGDFRYPNEIGPGVYDIHSPRVPDVEDMVALLEKAARVIDPEQLWVNPDCGLKTRGWPETEAALANMVTAARRLRARFEQREMSGAQA